MRTGLNEFWSAVPVDCRPHPDLVPGSFLLILVLLFSLGCGTVRAEVSIGPAFQSISLAGRLQFLDDPANAYTLPEVMARYRAGKFRTLPGSLNRGFTRAASWLTFSVRNDSGDPRSLVLLLSPPCIDEVDLYIQTGVDPERPESFRREPLGEDTSVPPQPLLSPELVVPLRIQAGASKRIYIRTRNGGAQTLQVRLLSPAVMARQGGRYIMLQGGYLAMALALAIINFILAQRLKDRTYALYGLHLVTMFLGTLGTKGMINLLWPAMAHHLDDFLVGIRTGLGFSTMCAFAIVLFRTRSRHPWIHRYLQAILVLGIAVFLASGSPWYGRLTHVLMLNGFVGIVLLLWLAWEMARQGEVAGRIFLIAFSIPAVGAAVTFLWLLGLLPVNDFTQYSLQGASIVHMVLMTLGLSEPVIAVETAARAAHRQAERKAVRLAEQMTGELRDQKKEIEKAFARERQIKDAQGRFIDLVSHEYRTPLSILKTNIDILDLKQEGTAIARRVGVMRQAVTRLENIFNDSLRKSDWDEHHPMDFRPLELSGFLAEAVGRHRAAQTQPASPPLGDPEVSGPVWIHADRTLLATILSNLFDNARKYARGGQPIRVALEADDFLATLTVGNSCAPFTMADADDLIGRGTRGPNAGKLPGHGMGLYLVRQMAGALQAKLSLRLDHSGWFEAVIRFPVWEDSSRSEEKA